MKGKKPASRGAQGGDGPGHKAAAGDAWRKEIGILRNGGFAEVRYNICDYGGKPPGDWLYRAEESVNAANINYDRRGIDGITSDNITALAEVVATADPDTAEGVLARLKEVQEYWVKHTANAILGILGHEHRYPEAEDEYEWWRHEECAHQPGEEEYNCHTDPLVDDDDNQEYEGKAWCRRHYRWVHSKVTTCISCGGEVTEREFHDHFVETGDEEAVACTRCVKAAGGRREKEGLSRQGKGGVPP